MRFFTIMAILLVCSGVLAAQDATTGKNDGKDDQELSRLKVLKEKLALENAIAEEKLKKVLRDLQFQQQKADLENRLQAAKQQQTLQDFQKNMQQIQLEILQLKKELDTLMVQNARENARFARLKLELDLRESRKKAAMLVQREPVYTLQPWKDGILTISDRRIALNGPIVSGVADHVTRRIHFFNNLNQEYPIFIVIDVCPGGSVMEGYRILKAMEASKAPVYVVVKSFAASMAAVITTLAKKSFAYPNAIILHHQISTVNWGNMTEIQEQLQAAREWEKRLHEPVAARMGITVKDFVKLMYRNNSRGDWKEFADKAVTFKWVDHVVKGIEELSITEKPDDKMPLPPWFWGQKVLRDAAGARYVELPRLSPYDFYHIYNPDRYYR